MDGIEFSNAEKVFCKITHKFDIISSLKEFEKERCNQRTLSYDINKAGIPRVGKLHNKTMASCLLLAKVFRY